MNIKAVIWDLGGVLVRTEDPSPREHLAAQLGISRKELEKQMFATESGQLGQLGQISGEEHWARVSADLGIPKDDLINVFFSGDHLDNELILFIRELQSRYKTALLSNAFSTLRHHLTKEWHIGDAFDEIVISADVGLLKPDGAIYSLTLERLAVEADAAVFIDDFGENVAGAREAGLHAIHFRTSEQTLKELEILLGSD